MALWKPQQDPLRPSSTVRRGSRVLLQAIHTASISWRTGTKLYQVPYAALFHKAGLPGHCLRDRLKKFQFDPIGNGYQGPTTWLHRNAESQKAYQFALVWTQEHWAYNAPLADSG